MTTTLHRTVGLEHAADAVLFRELGSAGAADRERIQTILVRRYGGLVRGIAAHYSHSAADHEELRQVGFVGLVLAIQRFDPERGFDFAAFARPTVTGEIRRHFRDRRRWVRLPRRVAETKALITGATESLTHSLGRSPTVPELADRLGLGPEAVLESVTVDDAFVVWSLDAPMGADDNDSWTLGDSLGIEDERFELLLDLEALVPLVAALSDRDRRILHLRFVEELTQVEIGRQLGCSQMHISRILARTFDCLRTGLLAN